MPSTISAGTTAGTAIAVAGDTTGNLAFQTNGTTTAMTIDTSQNVTLGGATANLYVNSTTAANNSNLWIRSGGADTLGLEAQAPTSAGGGAGAFISLRNPAGTLNFRTTTSGGSLNTQATIDGNGVFAFNSGYGSVATAYGCRAWVNFNGTGTVAIRASGNVTSITDDGAGLYTVNFTTAMPDANYCVAGVAGKADGGDNNTNMRVMGRNAAVAQTTSAVAVGCYYQNGNTEDGGLMCVAIFR